MVSSYSLWHFFTYNESFVDFSPVLHEISPTVGQSMLCAQLWPFVRYCGLWRKLDTWDKVIAINSSLLVCSQDENRKKTEASKDVFHGSCQWKPTRQTIAPHLKAKLWLARLLKIWKFGEEFNHKTVALKVKFEFYAALVIRWLKYGNNPIMGTPQKILVICI